MGGEGKMKELHWDYYRGYYYVDKIIKDKNILTKEEKKLLDDMKKSKRKKHSPIR